MKSHIHKKIIVAGLILITLVSCTHYIYISRSIWQGNPVVADGKPAEWSTPLKYYDDKSKLQFAVSNDFENLYFCIRATDEQAQAKILRAGLQIWIDTTGKNEHHVGILFPMASTIKRNDQNTGEHNTGEKHDVTGFRNKFLNAYKEMELVGFKPPINGMNPIQNNYGISVNINWDSSQIMTYEAAVPFKTFYKDVILVSDSLKLMGVSIILNALPMPQGGGSHGGGGGGMPGGGAGHGMPGGGGMRGGGGGGGMHGGGGRGGGGNGSGASQGSGYLFEANTIKKIFQLSVK